jgi:hypothetical protein
MNNDKKDDKEDQIRSGSEAARRLLTVFSVWATTAGAPRTNIREWLTENGLKSDLTPTERTFLDLGKPTKNQQITRSWDAERIVVLMWALGYIGELPPADQQCDTSCFQDHLPPYQPVEVTDFIKNAKLRPDVQLHKMQAEILNLHWNARDGALNNRAPTKPVVLGIIQERHHAINWIIGYDGGMAWDDVTTDT